MKRIHFDSKGPVPWHNFFWEPWGCGGCLLRTLGFVLLLALFLFLLSQFRSCRDTGDAGAGTPDGGFTPGEPVSVVVPPINEDDIIDDGGRRLVANRLNVLFGAECGRNEYESWTQQFRALYPDTINRVLFYDPDTKLMALQVDSERRQEMLQNLNRQIPDIPFLVFEEDVLTSEARLPDDAVFQHHSEGHDYIYDQIKVFDAWSLTQGNPNTVVAVVDDFFDLNHPDLASLTIVSPHSVALGNDNVGTPADYDPENPRDTRSHGTHTASLAVGAVNNGKGIAGIAPGCRFMPISMGDPFGSLAMVQGVLYAINHRATVINISAGSYFLDEIRELPVEQQVALSRQMSLDSERVWDYIFAMCERNYITIVWAAGNQDVFTALDSSKRNANTIRVSAVDRNMTKADFSNFGNFAADSIFESTLSAPGVDVAAAKAGTEGYALVPGTSFSSPIVAGCVGLVKSMNPLLSNHEIIDLLQSTGRAARGQGASTIGPVVQIGPALEQLSQSLVRYTDFSSAVAAGSGSFTIGALWYLNIEDEAALPPIYIVTINPTGANRGEVVYADNRTPQSIFKSTYTATSNDQNIELTVEPAIRVEGPAEGVAPERAHFTFASASAGNTLMASADASWIDGEVNRCLVLRAR